MNRPVLAYATTLAALCASNLLAGVITPVSATPSGSGTPETAFGLDDASNLIDGSGLSATPTLANLSTVTHAAFDAPGDNSWAATGSVILDFDLGGLTAVSGVAIWNFQADDAGDRMDGSNDISVLFFSDGAGSIIDSFQSISVPEASASGEAAIIPLTPVASTNYIVLVVNSNHGGSRAGLSEVRFFIPEPASIGFAAVVLFTCGRRQRGVREFR